MAQDERGNFAYDCFPHFSQLLKNPSVFSDFQQRVPSLVRTLGEHHTDTLEHKMLGYKKSTVTKLTPNSPLSAVQRRTLCHERARAPTTIILHRLSGGTCLTTDHLLLPPRVEARRGRRSRWRREETEVSCSVIYVYMDRLKGGSQVA